MIRYFYSIIFVLFLLSGCGKEQSYVPDVAVNYSVTLQEFSIKQKDNVMLVADRGVGGLIIVRTPDGYACFDRCSTVNPEKICRVNPDEFYLATDPCSGAKFSLLDGSPQKAPAERSLKTYNISLQGNTLLNVRN